MDANKIIPVLVLFTLVLSLPAAGIDDASIRLIAGKPAEVQYPFIAEVTGNDVYIRSGKGTAYYHCGKANAGDKITVFEEVFGWAKILPPPGCYSWIHKDYVDVEADMPMVGDVTGDNVRVWAGSDYIQPMRSSSMQTKLNIGEIVELMPDQPESGDYYKIKPPARAYLWINCEYLKYFGPVQQEKPVVIPPRPIEQSPAVIPTRPIEQPTPDLPPSIETVVPTFGNLDQNKPAADLKAAEGAIAKPIEKPGTAMPADPLSAIEAGTTEAKLLEKCYALSAMIDQQLQKPLAEQSYDDVRKQLEAIKALPQAGKAETYSKILLERIGRYELAISIIDTLKEQDQTLAQTREKIEKAHQDTLKNLPKETNYIFSGVLKKSHVYTEKTGQQRYLLIDPAGKILCYTIPASAEIAGQLEGMVGRRVGIQGAVSDDLHSLKTLIKTTTVKSLQ